MVTVNGIPQDVNGLGLVEFLEREGYSLSRIVVEHNRRIVPKGEYGALVLQDGDVLEIVHFVGGG